jgi:hypothetical protein
MSDTIEKIMCAVQCFAYPRPTIENVVKKIEDQSDQLAKQCVKLVEEIGELRASLEKEERRRLGAEACLQSWKEDEGADAKRLEWVCARSNGEFYSRGVYYELTRESIDTAMEAANNE